MKRLNLPTYSFNIKSQNERSLIFDRFRNKWVALTPEEWVRQNISNFLNKDLNYPDSLISIEMAVKVNQVSKRCDIVVFNRQAKPVMIVECKAPDVNLNQKVFDQIARYNMSLGVDFLLITNGLKHYCVRLDHAPESYSFLRKIPDYRELDSHSSRNS